MPRTNTQGSERLRQAAAVPTAVIETAMIRADECHRATQPYLTPRRLESSQDLESAVRAVADIQRQIKAIQFEQNEIAKPIQQGLDAIKNLFAPPLKALHGAREALKREIKRYQTENVETHRAMLQDATTPEEVSRAVEVLAPVPSNMHERSVWSWEVTDVDKIPSDYWILDEKRIDREVREQKANYALPGIKVLRDTSIVVRAT